MYDIVKTQSRNGKTLYYTVEDTDEDEYVNDLTDAEKNNSGEKSFPGKIIKVYGAKYFITQKKLPSICHPLDRLPDSRTFDDSFYRSFFKDVFSPPPDHLIS